MKHTQTVLSINAHSHNSQHYLTVWSIPEPTLSYSSVLVQHSALQQYDSALLLISCQYMGIITAFCPMPVSMLHPICTWVPSLISVSYPCSWYILSTHRTRTSSFLWLSLVLHLNVLSNFIICPDKKHSRLTDISWVSFFFIFGGRRDFSLP